MCDTFRKWRSSGRLLQSIIWKLAGTGFLFLLDLFFC